MAVSRAVDDRRRRRLAVSGEAQGADTAEVESSVGVNAAFRERIAELPSASPWLPLPGWRRVLVLSGFWLLLGVLAFLVTFPGKVPGELSLVIAPLTTGPSPRLAAYVDVALWLLAAELAGLVGWYRAHSLSDFSGRYRIWGWVSLVFLLNSFVAGTGLHLLLADAYVDRLPWLVWRKDVLAWLAPWFLVGLATFWLLERDVRRCRVSTWLLRMAGLLAVGLSVGTLGAPEWECESWHRPVMVGGRCLAMGCLITGLWVQACFVAYICPDPPEKIESRTWWGFCLALGNTLLLRWWLPEEEEAEEPPKRTRRRKKSTEEAETATPRRKRKATTTRSRKAPSRRTRVAVETEVEAGEDEQSSDEEWSSEQGDFSDDSSDRNWNEEDEELARLEELTRPAATRGAGSGSTQSRASQDADDDSSFEDEGYQDIDQAHSSSDMYKGLSKRQRRELKKRQREYERQE